MLRAGIDPIYMDSGIIAENWQASLAPNPKSALGAPGSRETGVNGPNRQGAPKRGLTMASKDSPDVAERTSFYLGKHFH